MSYDFKLFKRLCMVIDKLDEMIVRKMTIRMIRYIEEISHMTSRYVVVSFIRDNLKDWE